MPFSFSTALSGLSASSTAIGVSGNNISNANTIGFKSGSVTFSDIFADSRGVRLNGAGAPVQTGNGVEVAAVNTRFTQGGLNASNSSTTAAIQGNGFFIVKDDQGMPNYTRAGDFTINAAGHLVTPGGQHVVGYPATNGVIQQNASLTPIQIPIGQTMHAVTTTDASVRLNLDRRAGAGATFHAPIQVYDSSGTIHSLDMIYIKQADGTYQMTASLDDNPAQTSVGGAAASSGPATFTFDSNGQMSAPTSLSIIPDQTKLNGATLPAIEIGLNQTNSDGSVGEPLVTNFASESAVSATSQNGFSAGIMSGITINDDGVVSAIFNNGQTLPVGQIALATFNAQGALAHAGGNLFGETVASGQPSIGSPGSGGRGAVIGGMLEQSNVDITSEFVDLIVAQRGFQANSRVISTINQAMQDLLQTI
jgi:flagellar hook protein FlgE